MSRRASGGIGAGVCATRHGGGGGGGGLGIAGQGGFSIAWAGVPIAIFAALLVAHDQTLRALERRRRAVAYFERALARLDGDWAGRGETGERYLDPAHPYAQDLDLFGKGSRLRAALHRAHAHRRGHAGALAAGAGRAGRRCGSATRRSTNCGPVSILREDLAVAGRRGAYRRRARRRWRPGAKLPRSSTRRARGPGPGVFTALGCVRWRRC